MQASINDLIVVENLPLTGIFEGFVGFGAGGFYPVVFDDFNLTAGEYNYNYHNLLHCTYVRTCVYVCVLQADWLTSGRDRMT